MESSIDIPYHMQFKLYRAEPYEIPTIDDQVYIFSLVLHIRYWYIRKSGNLN